MPKLNSFINRYKSYGDTIKTLFLGDVVMDGHGVHLDFRNGAGFGYGVDSGAGNKHGIEKCNYSSAYGSGGGSRFGTGNSNSPLFPKGSGNGAISGTGFGFGCAVGSGYTRANGHRFS